MNEEFIIKSRIEKQEFIFSAPEKGGYVRLWHGNPAHLPHQICEGGGVFGQTLWANARNLERVARRWYRAYRRNQNKFLGRRPRKSTRLVSREMRDIATLGLPFAESVISAWTKASAIPGWFTVNDYGFPGWSPTAMSGSVPGFRFDTWKKGVIGKLPAPDSTFGLDLGVTTQITDAGVTELAELDWLIWLYLCHTLVTDSCVTNLARIKRLTTLDLCNTRITDAGVAELEKLENLTAIHLGRTQVTDEGLERLARLNKLTTLHLCSTRITDAGVAELAKLENLVTLNLSETRITYAGVENLVKLEKLTWLNLYGVQITDTVLEYLAKLKNLTFLNLCGTLVTRAGVTELKKALPACSIYYF